MSDASLWDLEAATFDEAVDHGLRDVAARLAWEELLLPVVGRQGARVADLGCGTGTLSLLLAEHGHTVTGVDFSSKMIERARGKAKAAHRDVTFIRGDAAEPPLERSGFDVVLSRHVLWAMPDPARALRRWAELLDVDGVVVLVEGRWRTGVGLPAAETAALLEAADLRDIAVRALPDPRLWGGPVSDERYLATARR